MKLRFADFTLDLDCGELRGPDGVRHVEPKVFAVVRHLAENTDRVIGLGELIETVWGGLHVSDAAVATVIKLARKAVDDTGDAQAVIRTVRGQGFRMVAPVTILSAAEFTVGVREPLPTQQDATRGPPTIAVLPFRMPAEAGTPALLGDAVAAEVAAHLSRLRWLRVIARESSFRFRGATVDLGALRSVLGADYAVTGEMWLDAPGRWSAQVELSDTRNQSVLWTDRISADAGDVSAFREAVAAAVLAELEIRLPLNEATRAQAKPVDALDAWEAFHLGLRQAYRFTREGNAEAAALFERATALDPFFAPAFAARSFTSFQDVFMGYAADRARAIADVQRFAERGIEIDPLDPATNFAMGRSHLVSRRPDDCIDWLDRAIELNPSYAKAHYSRGFAQLQSARGADATASLSASIRLSPLDPLIGPMLTNLGVAHLAQGRLSDAADLTARGARLAPNHTILLMAAAAAAILVDDVAAAAHWRGATLERRPDASVSQFRQGPQYAPELDSLMHAALRRAGFPD
jgi:TolB-like protein